MGTKRLVFYVGIAIFVLAGLAACTRSLAPAGGTTPVAATATQGTPGATGDVMEQIWMLATQTAMAQQGAGQPQATQVPAGQGTSAPSGTAAPAQATSVPPTATKAPTTTMLPVPTATPGLPKTYTLQGGEFPFCIARRFNVNQYELLNASGLSLSSHPQTGYTLTIPQTGNPFDGNRTLRAHPATYTVAAGDTLNSIACLFGDVSPDAIAAANGLTSTKLSAGQTLQIP
jgi:spore germination protein YaaH